MEPTVLACDDVGDGEPLILVPGGLTGWLSWIPHQERLRAHRRVVRVQPIHNELGSAGEPGDPEYSSEIERESLLLTLDGLGIERADFGGWSAGGRALIEFTLTYPARVRSLILVEPAAYWILGDLGDDDPVLDVLNQFLHGLAGRVVTEDDLAEFLVLAGFAKDTELARQDPNWERWASHRMALSWQSEHLDRSGRTVGELESINCPVLLIKGTATAPWEKRVVDILGDRMPKARVVELEGDHASHIESIDDFITELETHLDSVA